MEIKLVIEIGPETKALISALTGGATVAATKSVASPAPKAAVAKAAPAPETVSEAIAEDVVDNAPAPKAAVAKPAAAKAAPAPKAAVAKPAAAKAAPASKGPAFEDLDEDGQLEAIKAHVTRQTKNSKSADVKAMLAHFEVSRASELTPEQYAPFNEMISRFGKGETVADLIAEAGEAGEDDLT